ncbi:hypothetical protein HYD46_02020 [Mycoplasmopsis bovis]|nr:hypothetical protein [Mycoplasmopsis bovis]QQH78217.1 hypothetical protein HYD46_02020 [Mycoplasmopsis bovis]
MINKKDIRTVIILWWLPGDLHSIWQIIQDEKREYFKLILVSIEPLYKSYIRKKIDIKR